MVSTVDETKQTEADVKVNKKVKTNSASGRGQKPRLQLDVDKKHIKMILRSYDKDALRCGLQHVLQTLKSTGSVVESVVRFPIRKKLYTVLRSPHIDKTSREQFQLKTHKCAIYLVPNSQTMDVLRVMTLPTAVDVILK